MFRILAVLLVLVSTSGCATITRGTSESFTISTNPPGADAHLTNGLSCKTPCSLKVKRRGDFTVKIAKEGYEPVEAIVTSSVDGGGAAGMAGNVLVGGIIGAGVDAGSGAMHSHKPNPLEVTLLKLDEATVGRESAADTSGDGVDPFGFSGEAEDAGRTDGTEMLATGEASQASME